MLVSMTQEKTKENRYWQRFFVFFIVILLVFSCISMFVIARVNENQLNQKRYLLESKANAISDQVDMLISRVQVMRYMLMADKGRVEGFYELAPEIVTGWDNSNTEIISNVALAPDGVVSAVHPLKKNEALIGYDLWKAAEGSPDAVRTLKKGKVLITPPIDLMQGGSGMIISLPVTLYGEAESWGLVAMVVNADKLANAFMLQDFASQQVEYALSYKDLNGDYINMVTSGKPVIQPISLDFTTENMEWRLSITGAMDSGNVFTVVLLLVVMLVVAVLLATSLADQKRRKQMNQMFHELANTDNVTGCNTRHFVYEKLVDKETGAWRYEGLKYSLAILDVDKFKQVNDTWGHDVGDEILQRIAQILLNALSRNKGDCAIRFGGDEFVLLFGDRTPDQVRDILYHVLTKVREISLKDYPDIKVSVSIGGVHPDRMEEEATYMNMLRAADDKLYHAKNEGRNRCVL